MKLSYDLNLGLNSQTKTRKEESYENESFGVLGEKMWKLTHMTTNVSQGEINWNEEMHKGLPLSN